MFHKRLLKEFQSNQKYIIGMVAVQWISLLFSIAMMAGTALYITRIYQQRADAKETIWYFLLFILVVLGKGSMTAFENKMSFLASTKVKNVLREKIYQKLAEIGADYREKIATSEAVQISTEGVEQLEIYFGKYVPQFFYSLLAPLTLFAVTANMSLKVAFVLLLCVPLIPLSIVAVQKFAKKMLNKYWGTYTELGDSFLESLQGLTTLKIYQADEQYAKKMDEEAEKFRKITMRVLIMQLNSISVMDLVAYGGAAVGIILSILEYQKGNLTLGQSFFIIMISAEFFLPLRRLGSFFHIAMNGNAAANKIFHLLDMEIGRTGGQSISQGKEMPIRFEKVSFGYTEEKDILKDISFDIKRNHFTAIAGESGCGKSTIASLIMGELKQYKGNIRINEIEGKELSREEKYQYITRVKHDSYLLKGTVEENLRMGKETASEQELKEVLKQVDLYDTIMEKGGLSMMITEKASNLSGGQKQRLALARAILHDSAVYIFDEATSNVDAESENKIIEVIEELARTKTVILISHRLANLKKADQILVLKEGKIKERGTHQELQQQGGFYHQLYEKQKRLEKYAAE